MRFGFLFLVVAGFAIGCASKVDKLCDINRDGKIDGLDQLILVNAFNSEEGDLNFNPRADLNKDRVVNGADFNLFSQRCKKED